MQRQRLSSVQARCGCCGPPSSGSSPDVSSAAPPSLSPGSSSYSSGIESYGESVDSFGQQHLPNRMARKKVDANGLTKSSKNVSQSLTTWDTPTFLEMAYISRKGYPSLPEDNQGKVILHNSRDCHFQVTFGDHSECPQKLYNDGMTSSIFRRFLA